MEGTEDGIVERIEDEISDTALLSLFRDYDATDLGYGRLEIPIMDDPVRTGMISEGEELPRSDIELSTTTVDKQKYQVEIDRSEDDVEDLVERFVLALATTAFDRLWETLEDGPVLTSDPYIDIYDSMRRDMYNPDTVVLGDDIEDPEVPLGLDLYSADRVLQSRMIFMVDTDRMGYDVVFGETDVQNRMDIVRAGTYRNYVVIEEDAVVGGFVPG